MLSNIVWKLALPKLKALIEQERAERIRAAFEARLNERRAEVQPYYANFVQRVPADIRPFMPNLFDACHMPSLLELTSANDAQTKVTLSRFSSVEHRLLMETREYVARAKYDLVEMLYRERQRTVWHRDGTPMSMYTSEPIDAELRKGTALFVCHHCPLKHALSAVGICTHWRTEHPGLKWNDRWPPDEHEDQRRRRDRWPKKVPWIDAKWEGETDAKIALEALGLAENATHADLDALVQQGRLVCMCGSPRLPPLQDSCWAVMVRFSGCSSTTRH